MTDWRDDPFARQLWFAAIDWLEDPSPEHAEAIRAAVASISGEARRRDRALLRGDFPGAKK